MDKEQRKVLLEALITIATNKYDQEDIAYCIIAAGALDRAIGKGWRNMNIEETTDEQRTVQ